jgi:MSHA biogenesis protein MshP
MKARGIALPAMVFLLVIVALMIGAGVQMLLAGSHTQSLQIQQARALAAAKAGAEWALWQVSDRDGLLGLDGSTLPPCFADRTLALPAPLDGLQVQLSCLREPASGSLDEGGLKLASYRVQALASSGSAGAADFVQRRFEARHTVCKNPGALAPSYAC